QPICIPTSSGYCNDDAAIIEVAVRMKSAGGGEDEVIGTFQGNGRLRTLRMQRVMNLVEMPLISEKNQAHAEHRPRTNPRRPQPQYYSLPLPYVLLLSPSNDDDEGAKETASLLPSRTAPQRSIESNFQR